jgi:hypothetical protein
MDPNAKQPENPAGEEAQVTEPVEDFAGYGSLEAMKQAVYASRTEGKRLADENKALRGYAEQVKRLLPSERREERRAIDEINDLGLPSEVFQRAVKEQIHEELVREMAPVSKTNEAVSKIRSSNQSFSKLESDFNKWLTANPEVASEFNNAVQAMPDAAQLLLEGVFARFEGTRRANPDSEPNKIPSGAKLPNSQSAGAGRQKLADDTPTKEEMVELLKGARRTRDPVPMMRAILGDRPIHRDFARDKG